MKVYPMTRLHSISALLVSLAIVTFVSVAGAQMTAISVSGWYVGLSKPPLNPPDWVFAPVWTILYVLMAVAAWRIYKLAPTPQKRSDALTVYFMQLALNLAWSYFFFYEQNIFSGLIDIIALWGLIAATLMLFTRIDALAGRLIIPYLVWVTFALYLNAGIWLLNP